MADNSNVYDLLVPTKQRSEKLGKKLTIGSGGAHRCMVVGKVTEVEVDENDEKKQALALLRLAENNRKALVKTDAQLAELSSDKRLGRGSLAVTFEVLKMDAGGKKRAGAKADKAVTYSAVTLIEVGGKGASNGLKEERENLSLEADWLSLSMVLSAARKLQGDADFMKAEAKKLKVLGTPTPEKVLESMTTLWSDRKHPLTRLLKGKIGGNSLCVMLGCVSPAHGAFTATKKTLELIGLATGVVQLPVENELPVPREKVKLVLENAKKPKKKPAKPAGGRERQSSRLDLGRRQSSLMSGRPSARERRLRPRHRCRQSARARRQRGRHRCRRMHRFHSAPVRNRLCV